MRFYKFQVLAKRTTLVALLCIGVLLGLLMARSISWRLPVWIGLAVPIAIVAARKHTRWGWLLLLLMGFALGVLRGGSVWQTERYYNELHGQEVTLVGRVTDDAIYGKQSQLSFDIKQVRVTRPITINLPGMVAIEGFGENDIDRDSTVQVTGKLYRTRGSRQASIRYAQIDTIIIRDTWLSAVRRRFLVGLGNALPEPHNAFAAGLLIGQRSVLPERVTNELKAVGLMHLVAVSGYNLTIIVHAIERIWKKRSKKLTLLSAGVCIVTFLLMTDMSASIVRAAWISGLGLLAAYYGRVIKPWLLIVLVAAVTAYMQPLYIWSDIGWYMSFAAFAGILLVAPAFVKRFYKQRKPKFISGILIETVAAQIMVLPISLFIFGQFSAIGLLFNLVIVPLVPFAMAASFAAGVAGAVMPTLAGWLAWPARLVLTYMLDCIHFGASLPGTVAGSEIVWWQVVWLYGLIGLLLIIWRLRTRTTGGAIDLRKITAAS